MTPTHRSALLGAVSAFALLAGSARAATLSATPANIVAQVRAAHPGDVVEMQAGAWGDLNLNNIVKASPGVTIHPAAGVAITVPSLDTQGSSWLTIENLDVQFSGKGAVKAVNLSLDSRITINKVKIHQASAANADGFGPYIRNASYVTVSNSEIYYLGIAIASLDSDHTTVTNTNIHDVTDDIMDLFGSPNATITGNTATAGNFSGSHPDFIQFDVGATHKDNCGSDVENNRYDRGTSKTLANGIFGIVVCNSVIKGNVLRGANGNGIYIGASHDLQITGNFVQGYKDMGSNIIVSADDTNVTVTGNAANGYVVAEAERGPGFNDRAKNNSIDKTNSAIREADHGNDTALTTWRAQRGAATATSTK